MSALMKMHTTDKSSKTISVTVPNEIAEKVYRTIHQLFDFADIRIIDNSTLTIEDIFPDGDSAMALRGLRVREGITQQELAKRLSISQNRVSEMETGKRSISKAMAKRLESLFGVSYKAFL